MKVNEYSHTIGEMLYIIENPSQYSCQYRDEVKTEYKNIMQIIQCPKSNVTEEYYDQIVMDLRNWESWSDEK